MVLYFHSEKQETFIESQLHHDPASSARKKNAAKSPFKVWGRRMCSQVERKGLKQTNCPVRWRPYNLYIYIFILYFSHTKAYLKSIWYMICTYKIYTSSDFSFIFIGLWVSRTIELPVSDTWYMNSLVSYLPPEGGALGENPLHPQIWMLSFYTYISTTLSLTFILTCSLCFHPSFWWQITDVGYVSVSVSPPLFQSEKNSAFTLIDDRQLAHSATFTVKFWGRPYFSLICGGVR